jgi:hypothetical protein
VDSSLTLSKPALHPVQTSLQVLVQRGEIAFVIVAMASVWMLTKYTHIPRVFTNFLHQKLRIEFFPKERMSNVVCDELDKFLLVLVVQNSRILIYSDVVDFHGRVFSLPRWVPLILGTPECVHRVLIVIAPGLAANLVWEVSVGTTDSHV